MIRNRMGNNGEVDAKPHDGEAGSGISKGKTGQANDSTHLQSLARNNRPHTKVASRRRWTCQTVGANSAHSLRGQVQASLALPALSPPESCGDVDWDRPSLSADRYLAFASTCQRTGRWRVGGSCQAHMMQASSCAICRLHSCSRQAAKRTTRIMEILQGKTQNRTASVQVEGHHRSPAACSSCQ